MPSLTIGLFSANYLREQPFGYEGDARQGLTARKWMFDCILTNAQVASLLSVYDTWRNARILDADTEVSGVVGTTVALTCDSIAASVTNLPCWFIDAPKLKTLGQYTQATVELVDAAQALEVLLRGRELDRERKEPLHGAFGTWTLGTTSVVLLNQPYGYRDGPKVETLATGKHYISGPQVATKTFEIEGTTDAAGWANIREWYEETLVERNPNVGSEYPLTPPTATAEAIVENGVKSTRYTVKVTLIQIR